ncbi:hypothetical protein BDZ89DRAFT_1127884 [Hymenopellis radicata]|nr:hypothetical protein BDZ89DRAFT_1127884 [Hymenopellis radicata]
MSLPSSDTESDSEADFVAFDHSYRHLRRIYRSLVAAIRKDTSIHTVISAASQVLIQFLDNVGNRTFEEHAQTQFALLLRPAFLRILFEHRRVFHAIAASEVSSHASSTIVCWVDSVLVKIADAAVALISGSNEVDTHTSEPWRPQREDDNLRGASQLPGSWDLVGTVLNSQHASPAAKRIGIRLLFATCITLPSVILVVEDEIKLIRRRLLEPLRQCVLNTVTGGFRANYSSDPIVEQERINFAMMITLYAAAETELDRCSKPVLEQPHTLSCLLDLLHVVMFPDDVVTSLIVSTPLTELDTAQRIVVDRYDTLYWLWRTWDDLRLANTEIVSLTTAAWLYHTPHLLPSVLECETRPSENDPRLAGNAILHVLFHYLSFLKSHPANVERNTRLLHIMSETLLDLLREDACHHRHQVCNREDLCTVFYELWVYIGDADDELSVKETLVEALVLFDTTVMNSSILKLIKDISIDFMERVNSLLGRCMQPLTSRRQLKSTLDFVVCLRHSNFTALGHTTHDTAMSLFRIILAGLCEWPRVTQSHFAATLFVALSQEKKPSRMKVLDQAKLWHIFTTAGPTDLYQAAGFSQMIAEAWDCLRDVLLLIIRGRFFGDEEALAILVCPVICRALIHLLRQPHSHVNFILHSPWTATLLLELQNVVAADAPPLDRQGQVLQSRLRSVAKSLIDALVSQDIRKSGGPDKESTDETALVTCIRPDIGLQLVLFAVDLD